MGLQFAYPVYYWLPAAIAVVALAGFGLHRLERRRHGRLERFIQANLAPRLLVGYEATVRKPLFWLAVIGAVFLVLAIAQPHWGQSWQKVSKQSRDIMVLLDTSESMRAEDLLPNRLERAKYKVSSLMERMPGDRFGLVAFSGGAVLECPPTVDHGYMRAILDAIDTDTLSLEGTDISAAFDLAIATFSDLEESGTYSDRDQRAILLISDGEQVSGDAQEAAKKAAEYARIYVLGVGDPRGTEVEMPDYLSRYISSSQQTHVSRLDEDGLIRMANVGNGRYVRSEADDWDVEKLHEFMESVASRTVSSDVRLRYVNRYQWPLAAAILCFAAEGMWWVIMPLIRRWRARRAAASALGEPDHA